MISGGPHPKSFVHRRILPERGEENPKPQTVALAAEDAEFARNASGGARDNAKTYGFKVIYDKTFPPDTTDFRRSSARCRPPTPTSWCCALIR